VAGFVINKFRGDETILAPGLDELMARTGRPTLGVLPFVEDLWMDVEDSLALDASRPEQPAAPGGDTLDVAVLRLRWISNFTDVDALGSEPGVRVRFTRSAADLERADLVVIPGTKATVEDLERLRTTGLDRVLRARAEAGDPILGICGGYQLLGEWIEDDVESRRGGIQALGLLPVSTRFEPDKILRRRSGHSPLFGTAASGYEIRHGRVQRGGGERLLLADDGESDGCVAGSVTGTAWHGALEHDEFRRALLGRVASARGRRFVPGTTSFAAVRTARLDALGQLVTDHLDTAALAALIEGGARSDLPTIETEVRPCCAL
jgi:adenosylcobyric acid synthase